MRFGRVSDDSGKIQQECILENSGFCLCKSIALLCKSIALLIRNVIFGPGTESNRLLSGANRLLTVCKISENGFDRIF